MMINGEEIQTKVIEISSSEIKFKRFDNPNGPVYTLSRPDVFYIIYANGKKDIITPMNTDNTNTGNSNTGNTNTGNKTNKISTKPTENKTTIETQNNRSFHFGFKAGLNFANMKFISDSLNYPYTYNNRIAYHFGLIICVDFSRFLSFQPGLLISSKGYKIKKENYVIRPLYIEIPACIAYHFTLANNKKLYIAVGPYLGIGIGGKIYKNGVYLEDATWSDGSNSGYKRSDWGICFEEGIKLPQGFQISINYNLGLSNIYYDYYSNNNDRTKNRLIGISLAYYITK